MFSNVTEEIEETEWSSPISIIDEQSRVYRALEIKESRELSFDAVDVMRQLFAGEQIALSGLS